MKKQRLLKLADFLDTVPPGSFEMSRWVDYQASEPEGDKPGECGFAGCAMGWAVHARLFRGLTFERSFGVSVPFFDGESGFHAAEKLFGISDPQAEKLFSDEAYQGNPKPKTVARRIRKLVATS